MRARASEELALRRSHLAIAASDEVRVELLRRMPAASAHTVPNGVRDELLEDCLGPSPYEGGLRHAVSTIPADASPANLTALRLLADVASRFDAADKLRIHVLGTSRGPTARFLHYHGVVPDIQPWLVHADACLLPYSGEGRLFGGARNKLLEALACAQRLVTTEEGLRGFATARHWPGVTVAGDRPADFAETLRKGVVAKSRLSDVPSHAREGLRWGAVAGDLAGLLELVAA